MFHASLTYGPYCCHSEDVKLDLNKWLNGKENCPKSTPGGLLESHMDRTRPKRSSGTDFLALQHWCDADRGVPAGAKISAKSLWKAFCIVVACRVSPSELRINKKVYGFIRCKLKVSKHWQFLADPAWVTHFELWANPPTIKNFNFTLKNIADGLLHNGSDPNNTQQHWRASRT